MEKSATDIVQEAIFAAVLDAIAAWKAASGGLPNVMARDLAAVHLNTTFADLPKEVQTAIATSTRAAFNRLLKEGYAVAKGAGGRPPPAPRGPHAPPRANRPHGPGKPPVVETKRGPRGGRGGPPKGR